jgi:hypothetical protein
METDEYGFKLNYEDIPYNNFIEEKYGKIIFKFTFDRGISHHTEAYVVEKDNKRTIVYSTWPGNNFFEGGVIDISNKIYHLKAYIQNLEKALNLINNK